MPRELVQRPDRAFRADADSQVAYRVGELLVIGGIGPFDEAHNVVGATVEEQARTVLDSLGVILVRVGASFADVARTTCLLHDIERDFHAFTAVYREYFPAPRPARIAFGTPMGHVPGMLVVVAAEAVVGGA